MSSAPAAAPMASFDSPDASPSRATLSAPVIRNPKVAALSRAETQSKRLGEPTVTGRAAKAMAIASTPIGTLIANSHSHDQRDRIAAATVGPIAAETEITRAF